MRSEIEMRIPLGIGLGTMHVYTVAKNLSTFFLCPDNLWDSVFKGNRLINLVEEISKKPSIQTVTWVLLVAFSQIYSENWEQKAG
jgi:hypothetical protein